MSASDTDNYKYVFTNSLGYKVYEIGNTGTYVFYTSNGTAVYY